MDITPHVSSLEDHLAAVSAAGGESAARIAAGLTAALEPAARLAIMNALEELAVEVTDALGDRVVELHLDAGGVRVVATPLAEAGDDTAPDADGSGSADLSRITLRIPGDLKARAEQAAEREGLSLNTWFGNAVRRALRRGREGGDRGDRAHRVRGWVHG